MADANEGHINIKAFISDSAGEYAAARRQLRRKYPSKIFLPCMAYQMNLIFGEIFKESELYQRISKEVIRIVSFFHNSTFFTGNLRDEQKRIYQKTVVLITPGDTRWNSYYFCFHSILKSKSALKFLSAKFNDKRINITRNNGIPSIPADKKSTDRNGNWKLPNDIADIINDSEFWAVLFELQNLLYPLCGFLNKLQKDTARLYKVLHCFAYTTKILGNHHNLKFSSKMIARMESQWKKWEQPLLILSFALHPSHKLQKFRSSTPNIIWTHIGQWLKYYYESWFGSKSVSILRELVKYKRAEDPYNMDSFNQFHNNLVNFWDSTIGIGPELAHVAIRIHGICVNSALVKRLWSILAMSQIRSDILFARKIKDVRREIQHLHIATPINPDDGDKNEGPELIEEECIQLSDDENEENYENINNNNDNGEELTIQSEEQKWSQLIEEWIELGSLENRFENSEDEAFLLSE
ncbi:hypothetical protein RclHR1_02640025 [Rhizophagus clarus]|uniref:DUF659 domain-containing protein n=1 Tax=Rhizophagus clarus TaxID=94130 RepID=A0A2Z6RG65_9GLOM|nr:hypothetical protein RclHR1_02640025 [Rhizophagus clarus]